MALKLPAPASQWSTAYQIRLNQAAESEDIRNLKKGADIEIFPPQKLTLHSPDGKAWDVTVTNAGQIMPDLGGGAGSGGTVTSVGTGTGLTGGPITTAGTISLAPTSVTPGSYLNSNITVDAQGRITAASNGAAGGGGSVSSITAGVGLTGGTITTAGTIALANTAVTPGPYTKANITVDQQGRITAVANGADTFVGTVTSVGGGIGLTGGPITSAGALALADTAVTPGPYTNANITVDQQGRITAAANGPAPGVGTVTSVGSGTGLTGGPITGAGTLALANTAVTPGPYTKANITVDQQGRITAVANGSDSFVGTVTSITAGAPLTGGVITGAGTIGLADTAVTPGNYTNASITVDQKGRLTLASSGAAPVLGPAGANTQIQFNNGGAFGASANLTWDGGTLWANGTNMKSGPGGSAGFYAYDRNVANTDFSVFYRNNGQGALWDSTTTNILSWNAGSTDVTFSGRLLPAADLSKGLGLSSQRWLTLFAGDVRLVGTSGILLDGIQSYYINGDYLNIVNGTKSIQIGKSPSSTTWYHNTTHKFDDGGSTWVTINASGITVAATVSANLVAANELRGSVLTVAGLPPAASNYGGICYVADAATAGLAWGAAIGAGGGASSYLVWSNGATWNVIGR